jgi:hypothetical protein
MNYCPFHHNHHAYSEVDFVKHLSKHSPAYAKVMATAIRLGHTEKAQSMNEIIREIRRG